MLVSLFFPVFHTSSSEIWGFQVARVWSYYEQPPRLKEFWPPLINSGCVCQCIWWADAQPCSYDEPLQLASNHGHISWYLSSFTDEKCWGEQHRLLDFDHRIHINLSDPSWLQISVPARRWLMSTKQLQNDCADFRVNLHQLPINVFHIPLHTCKTFTGIHVASE